MLDSSRDLNGSYCKQHNRAQWGILHSLTARPHSLAQDSLSILQEDCICSAFSEMKLWQMPHFSKFMLEYLENGWIFFDAVFCKQRLYINAIRSTYFVRINWLKFELIAKNVFLRASFLRKNHTLDFNKFFSAGSLDMCTQSCRVLCKSNVYFVNYSVNRA